MQAITDTLESTDSAIGGFDDGMAYQTISSIKVPDKERLSIRFKDGTELEQEITEIGGQTSETVSRSVSASVLES